MVVIVAPDASPLTLDLISGLQLGIQKGRQDVGGQIARTNVHPGIFVHLTAEEAAAVGAFFTNDLSALDKARGVDQSRAALAAGEILGFVETLGGQAAEGAQVTALVLTE